MTPVSMDYESENVGLTANELELNLSLGIAEGGCTFS